MRVSPACNLPGNIYRKQNGCVGALLRARALASSVLIGGRGG